MTLSFIAETEGFAMRQHPPALCVTPFKDGRDRSSGSPLEGGAAKQRGVYASACAHNPHPPALRAFPPRRADFLSATFVPPIFKGGLGTAMCLVLLWCATLSAQETGAPALPPPAKDLKVVRFEENPIIRPDMLPGRDGENINGPSLIRVPEWLPNPLGRYYLYFADHHGDYIRLAYADRLQGPWKIYKPGTLRLAQVPDGKKHIASPDVVADGERKELRMYFHSPSKTAKAQTTYLARSKDGLHFTAGSEKLAPFYLRIFQHDGYWYGMTKRGWLCRSKDGLSAFEPGPNPFSGVAVRDGDENSTGIRHVALDLTGDRLTVYYSKIGDMPECILRSTITLTPDWKEWKAGAPELALKPEKDYEGTDIALAPSKGGNAKGRENALRDPAIFKEDGRTYLLYSVAGESGIGVAEITAVK